MKIAQDTIAEADVYLAYGRPAQAIEILQQAIKAQPARAAEFEAKLREIKKTPSAVMVRQKMPKVLLLPIAAGVINFLGIAFLDWPIWPGVVVITALMIFAMKAMINQANQQALVLTNKSQVKKDGK